MITKEILVSIANGAKSNGKLAKIIVFGIEWHITEVGNTNLTLRCYDNKESWKWERFDINEVLNCLNIGSAILPAFNIDGWV